MKKLKEPVNYADAYTRVLNYASKICNKEFETIVSEFRDNGIEKRFASDYTAEPSSKTVDKYKRLLKSKWS